MKSLLLIVRFILNLHRGFEQLRTGSPEGPIRDADHNKLIICDFQIRLLLLACFSLFRVAIRGVGWVLIGGTSMFYGGTRKSMF